MYLVVYNDVSCIHIIRPIVYFTFLSILAIKMCLRHHRNGNTVADGSNPDTCDVTTANCSVPNARGGGGEGHQLSICFGKTEYYKMCPNRTDNKHS